MEQVLSSETQQISITPLRNFTKDNRGNLQIIQHYYHCYHQHNVNIKAAAWPKFFSEYISNPWCVISTLTRIAKRAATLLVLYIYFALYRVVLCVDTARSSFFVLFIIY